MKIKGWELDYFNSGEWQVVDERLKDLEKTNRPVSDGYNPGRSGLFAALRATPLEQVRCIILGQDPYPERRFATGLAFSIPTEIGSDDFPPTLRTILKEYSSDLGRPLCSTGSLDRWAERGCLLWNAIPSCSTGRSLSHDWPEWECLTREIIRKLNARGVVYALLGQVSRRYLDDIDTTINRVVLTSHPSPRGSRAGKTPFVGSRLFSTINAKLNEIGREPIDWTLP